MDDQLLISSADAAAKLGVGRTLFFEMLCDGRLGPQPIRFGRKTLFRTDELEKWVQADCPPRNQWMKIRKEGPR